MNFEQAYPTAANASCSPRHVRQEIGCPVLTDILSTGLLRSGKEIWYMKYMTVDQMKNNLIFSCVLKGLNGSAGGLFAIRMFYLSVASLNPAITHSLAYGSSPSPTRQKESG